MSVTRRKYNRSGLNEFVLRLCSAEKWIRDQCSVKSQVGVVLGLSESSATWDSDLTDRAISLVWSSEDFLSFVTQICLVSKFKKVSQNPSSNVKHHQEVILSKKKNVKNDTSIFHLAWRFPTINNVSQWNETLKMYQSDQVILCCCHSYLRVFLINLINLI